MRCFCTSPETEKEILGHGYSPIWIPLWSAHQRAFAAGLVSLRLSTWSGAMSGSNEPAEVITIGLTSSDTDETHLRMALAYGATQQARVRLVVRRGYSPELLDTVIERHLDHVGRRLRVLPPLIEVQWTQRVPARADSGT